MTVATVDNYVSVYWTGLKTSLDAIDAAIYADLVANAAVTLEQFTHDFLTAAQVNQAQALLVCIDGGGMSSVAGFSQERHYIKLKVYDRTWQNDEKIDNFIGEFCRLLKITVKEYNSKTSATRSAIYAKTKSNSVYLAPSMDQRAQVFKDYELSDVATDRKAYPLDNRYL